MPDPSLLSFQPSFASRLLIRLLIAALIACMPPAQAAASAGVHLEQLTWTELKQWIAAGKTTIIVPVGGTEQNGPQMAIGKHNLRVRLLAERIATELGDALVAPVIAYVPEGSINPPSGHMRWPGTITIPNDAYRTVIEFAARSFRQHGFRHIVFIGDHGSYQQDNEIVARRLDRNWAPKVRVQALSEYYAAQREFARLLETRGYSEKETGSHAGLDDVSLMLAVEPGLVRPGFASYAGKPMDGADGDPRRASAELGRIGAELTVRRSVDAIRRFIAR